MLTKGKRIGREGDAMVMRFVPQHILQSTGWRRGIGRGSDGKFDQEAAAHHAADSGNIPANTVKPVA